MLFTMLLATLLCCRVLVAARSLAACLLLAWLRLPEDAEARWVVRLVWCVGWLATAAQNGWASMSCLSLVSVLQWRLGWVFVTPVLLLAPFLEGGGLPEGPGLAVRGLAVRGLAVHLCPY